MNLPLVPSSPHIFSVLPGVYPTSLLSWFLPVFLSLVELGDSSCIVLGVKRRDRPKLSSGDRICSPLYLQYHSPHLTLRWAGELISHSQKCLGPGDHSGLGSWEQLGSLI